jgi:hypothetical protein
LVLVNSFGWSSTLDDIGALTMHMRVFLKAKMIVEYVIQASDRSRKLNISR